MANRFLPAVVPSLRERLRSAMSRLPAGSGDALQELALRTLERADRVMGQLESTAGVLDKVAHLQLAVMQKLEPIVDDLQKLVRVQLEDATQRLVERRRGHGARGAEPEEIEVDPFLDDEG